MGSKTSNPSPFVYKEWGEKKYIIEHNCEISRSTMSLFDEGVIYGQYAAISSLEENTFEAVRDPLGIQKLFYCRDKNNILHFSRKFSDLFSYQSGIYSLPAGYKVLLSDRGIEKIRLLVPPINRNSELVAEAFRNREFHQAVSDFYNDFNCRLETVYKSLVRKEKEGWKIFIAMSGGLDSTIIASSAASRLENPVACTLDLGQSEDSEKAIKIAAHIGIDHKTFLVTREEILDAMGEAPYSCQDFRDFNVHCAALNILLARNVRALIDKDEEIDPEKVIILTGDLMNEFTCDYAGEIIDGKEYYKLPRVGKAQLQKYLIGGLDSSDREISPFASYGLTCIQPYAVLFDLYQTLDESVLLHGDPKKLVNLSLVDPVIGGLIPKVKLRAQVGSRENMGILGLCHSLGWDDKTYLNSLLKKAGIAEARIPIFVGRYDVEGFLND
jgi:hypothetical protein